MADPQKSPFDDFETVGESRDDRANKTWSARDWFWLTSGAAIAGAILFPLAYVGFVFWVSGEEIDSYRYRPTRRAAYEKSLENPLTRENMNPRFTKLAIAGGLTGVAAGLVLCARGSSRTRRNMRPED